MRVERIVRGLIHVRPNHLAYFCAQEFLLKRFRNIKCKLFISYAHKFIYNQTRVLQCLPSNPNTRFYTRTISEPNITFTPGQVEELNRDFNGQSRKPNESFYTRLSTQIKERF